MSFPPLSCNGRRLPASLVLAALLFSALPAAHAETTAALVEKLRAAAASETASVDADADSNPKDPETARKRVLRTQLRSLVQNLNRNSGYYDGENGYGDNFESLINQIDGCSSTEAVHKLCADILAQIKKDRESRAGELDDLFAKIRDAVLKANAPKDLDDLIQNLAARREQFNASSYSSSNSARARQDNVRLQQAVTFVNRWQDLLAAQAANNPGGALSVLRSLSNNSDSSQVNFVPRSEILARMQQLQQSSGIEIDSDSPYGGRQRSPEIAAKAKEILSRIKTIADLSAAMTELNKLTGGDANRVAIGQAGESGLASTLRQLDTLERNYRSIQAGFPTSLSLNMLTGGNTNSNVSGNNALVTSLARQLFALALPRVVGLPDDAVKPAPDEPADSLLRRLMIEAKQRGDWPALARAAETARTLGNFSNVAFLSPTDLEAYRFFFAGLTQEQASQWAQAVTSYQTALKSGSLELPSAFIGERLESARRDHAKEYEDGMNRFNNPPPAPTDPLGRPYPAGMTPPGGMMMRRPFDPMMGRMDGRGEPDATIPVPAAAPAPAVPPPAPAPSPK